MRRTDNTAFDIACDQYRWFERHEWTHAEMLGAINRKYLPGTTGDDVVIALVAAWNSLKRENRV